MEKLQKSPKIRRTSQTMEFAEPEPMANKVGAGGTSSSAKKRVSILTPAEEEAGTPSSSTGRKSLIMDDGIEFVVPTMGAKAKRASMMTPRELAKQVPSSRLRFSFA